MPINKIITIADNVKMADENDVAEMLKKSAEDDKAMKRPKTTEPAPTPELTPLQRLTTPVPEQFLEAYEEDGVKFNGYKAQYAINLLNEVYGLGNWFAEFELKHIENINKSWLAHGMVKIVINGKFICDGIGGSYARRIENSLKGCKTSAFKNACRYLGIGNELYLAGHDEDIVYEKIEETTPSEPIVNMPNEIKSTLDLINSSTSVSQLEGVLPLISKAEGKAVKELLIKSFNLKKIALNGK